MRQVQQEEESESLDESHVVVGYPVGAPPVYDVKETIFVAGQKFVPNEKK